MKNLSFAPFALLPAFLAVTTLTGAASAQTTKKPLLAATSPAEAPAEPPRDAPATEGTPAPEEKKASGWLFDGNLGLPRLKSNETSLAFDATVGWVGRSWGFGAYASSYTYALQQNDSLNQTQKMRFGLEARYLSGTLDSDVRYELKIEANSGAFNTTYIATNGVGGFSTEQSTLNRFTLMGGRRARVSERLRFLLEAGVGLQTDTYFRASDGGGDGDTNFSAASSARYVGRVRVNHRTLPDLLVLRGEIEASSFQLRRIAFFAGGAQTDADALSVTEFRETDVSLRLFGDIEKLAFLGLMPGVFAGLDYFGVSGGGRDTSAVVPIFGVGVINATPKD